MSLRKFRFSGQFAVWMAVAVLTLQPQWLLAAEPSATDPLHTTHTAHAMHVVDVALQTEGRLLGQLVDKQGRPLAATNIQLSDGRTQWRTQTDAQGRFQLAGLSGANYQLQVGGKIQSLRAWATGTAPPSAASDLLLVQDGEVILAQNCTSPACGSAVERLKRPFANPWVIGGLVAAAIAIPVAINNADDDDNNAPASP